MSQPNYILWQFRPVPERPPIDYVELDYGPRGQHTVYARVVDIVNKERPKPDQDDIFWTSTTSNKEMSRWFKNHLTAEQVKKAKNELIKKGWLVEEKDSEFPQSGYYRLGFVANVLATTETGRQTTGPSSRFRSSTNLNKPSNIIKAQSVPETEEDLKIIALSSQLHESIKAECDIEYGDVEVMWHLTFRDRVIPDLRRLLKSSRSDVIELLKLALRDFPVPPDDMEALPYSPVWFSGTTWGRYLIKALKKDPDFCRGREPAEIWEDLMLKNKSARNQPEDQADTGTNNVVLPEQFSQAESPPTENENKIRGIYKRLRSSTGPERRIATWPIEKIITTVKNHWRGQPFTDQEVIEFLDLENAEKLEGRD